MNKSSGVTTLEQQFTQAMFALGRQVRARMDERLIAADLSGIQLWALKHLLDADEEMAVGELARCLHSGRSNATQLVDRMAAEGLVRRVHDPHDRRKVRVQVTPEGMRRHQQGEDIHREVVREVMQPLSYEQRVQLVDMVQRMVVKDVD